MFRLGLVFFIYALCSATFVQRIVIPHLAPQLNGGGGLLIGTDAPFYHSQAVKIAEAIRINGLSTWRLRAGGPDGDSVMGLTSGIYALTWPEPWVVLPFNALLHALGGVYIFQFLLPLVSRRRSAIIGALPFVLFPSSL